MKKFILGWFLLFAFSQPVMAEAPNEKWLARVPDERLLSELSLPGTHDTMTYTGNLSWKLTKPYTRTQQLTLTEQLSAGIRYIDIRIKNNMGIYHGPAYLNSQFSDVLATVSTFLARHPSEAIVMRVKDEEMTNPVLFNQNIQPLITAYAPYFWQNHGKMPQLGEVRGKLVIFDNTGGSFQGPEGSLGFVYDDETQSIQDDYRKPSLAKKKSQISRQLRLESASKQQLNLNHISATAFYRTPRSYAKQLNPWLLSELSDPKINRTGILILDFPTSNLIEKIIQFNS